MGYLDWGLFLSRKSYLEDDLHWSKRLSPDLRSTAKKKGTGGIGYLSLENDDCDIDSIDDIGSCTQLPIGYYFICCLTGPCIICFLVIGRQIESSTFCSFSYLSNL